GHGTVGLCTDFSLADGGLFLVEAMRLLGIELTRRDALLDALFLAGFALVDARRRGSGGGLGECAGTQHGDGGADGEALEVHGHSLWVSLDWWMDSTGGPVRGTTAPASRPAT